MSLCFANDFFFITSSLDSLPCIQLVLKLNKDVNIYPNDEKVVLFRVAEGDIFGPNLEVMKKVYNNSFGKKMQVRLNDETYIDVEVSKFFRYFFNKNEIDSRDSILMREGFLFSFPII